ncbi:HEAT repeat domain-containing protein [bacterium]|nr:HEAT repeat domain-containing protein [candidate division CSSED10-310 bacterium]
MSRLVKSFLNVNHSRHDGIHRAETILENVRAGRVVDDLESWVESALDHPSWAIRNIAVKVVRLASLKIHAHRLCKMLLDMKQVGFIRRNAACALAEIGVGCPETLQSLEKALDDPYWEVRTASARSLASLVSPDRRLEEILISRIFKDPGHLNLKLPIIFPGRIYRERNFEVRMAMTWALGTCAETPRSLQAIRLLIQDDNWKVRNTALEAVCIIRLQRVKLKSEIDAILTNIDLSSTDFEPVFQIRQTWNCLNHSMGSSGNSRAGGD